jgi:hypothetical protein
MRATSNPLRARPEAGGNIAPRQRFVALPLQACKRGRWRELEASASAALNSASSGRQSATGSRGRDGGRIRPLPQSSPPRRRSLLSGRPSSRWALGSRPPLLPRGEMEGKYATKHEELPNDKLDLQATLRSLGCCRHHEQLACFNEMFGTYQILLKWTQFALINSWIKLF